MKNIKTRQINELYDKHEYTPTQLKLISDKAGKRYSNRSCKKNRPLYLPRYLTALLFDSQTRPLTPDSSYYKMLKPELRRFQRNTNIRLQQLTFPNLILARTFESSAKRMFGRFW